MLFKGFLLTGIKKINTETGTISNKDIISVFILILIFSLEDSLVIYKIIIIIPLRNTIISIYLIQVVGAEIASINP